MKLKYEDLKKVMSKLDRHSLKGDIDVVFSEATRSLTFSYTSNVDTSTQIVIGESELNRFVKILEEKWLSE